MTAAPAVDRHLGMYCCCPLLDCCHNERDGEPFGCGRRGGHVESGNPATGYLWPWTDEEYDAQQRYWNRPDPDEYPEGSLERLATEALLEDWRKNELAARQRGNDGGPGVHWKPRTRCRDAQAGSPELEGSAEGRKAPVSEAGRVLTASPAAFKVGRASRRC